MTGTMTTGTSSEHEHEHGAVSLFFVAGPSGGANGLFGTLTANVG